MGKVEYFDIPAEDVGKLKGFYEQAFGWEMSKVEGLDKEYWTINTKGGINGGIYKRQTEEQTPMTYATVDDIDAHLGKIKELGGKAVVGKTPVPGMGWFAVCHDPEGNPFGVWQEDKEAK